MPDTRDHETMLDDARGCEADAVRAAVIGNLQGARQIIAIHAEQRAEWPDEAIALIDAALAAMQTS